MLDGGFSQSEVDELKMNGGLSRPTVTALDKQLATLLSTSNGAAAMASLNSTWFNTVVAPDVQKFLNFAVSNDADIGSLLLSSPLALQHMLDLLNQFGNAATLNPFKGFLSGATVRLPKGNEASWNFNLTADQNIETFISDTNYSLTHTQIENDREGRFYTATSGEVMAPTQFELSKGTGLGASNVTFDQLTNVSVILDAGITLSIGSAPGSTIDFSTSSGTVVLSLPASFYGTISGFKLGTAIDLVGIRAISASIVSGDTLSLLGDNGGNVSPVFSLPLTAVLTSGEEIAVDDTGSGTDVYVERGFKFNTNFIDTNSSQMQGSASSAAANPDFVFVASSGGSQALLVNEQYAQSTGGPQAVLYDEKTGAYSGWNSPNVPQATLNEQGSLTVVQGTTQIDNGVSTYVSDTGFVAGTCTDPTNSNFTHAFVYENGTPQIVSASPEEGTFIQMGQNYFPAVSTYLEGINGSGEVIGSVSAYSQSQGGYEAAGFAGLPGSIAKIDYPGAAYSNPQVINDAGDIAGVYYDADYQSHIFTDEGGVYRSFLSFASLDDASVLAISPDGSVFGRLAGTNNSDTGFEIAKGTLTTFGSFSSITNLFANDSGVLAGNVYANTEGEGFVMENGSPVYLGRGSQILAVSPAGEIVGKNEQGQGFVDNDGLIESVNFPKSAETIITNIGASGTVYGNAYLPNGTAKAFIASPVGQPTPRSMNDELRGLFSAAKGDLLRSDALALGPGWRATDFDGSSSGVISKGSPELARELVGVDRPTILSWLSHPSHLAL